MKGPPRRMKVQPHRDDAYMSLSGFGTPLQSMCLCARFNDMFKENEEATHIRAAEVMREFVRDATI